MRVELRPRRGRSSVVPPGYRTWLSFLELEDGKSSDCCQRLLSTRNQKPSPGAVFASDAMEILEWMRFTCEELHLNPLVVASATCLALHHAHSLPSVPSDGDAGKTYSTWGIEEDRVVKSRPQTITAKLLSFTAAHLASKYHETDPDTNLLFGSGVRLKLNDIFKLGFDLSCHEGSSINAAFRANSVALVHIFCDAARASPTVRACSEYFSVCMILSSPYPPCYGRPYSSSLTPPPTDLAAFSRADEHPHPPLSGLQPDSCQPSAPAGCRPPNHKRPLSTPGLAAPTSTTAQALAALALARRLTRSRGSCLPLSVRAALGLSRQAALRLLTEGIGMARELFARDIMVAVGQGWGRGSGGAGVKNKGRNGGFRNVPLGDAFFGRMVEVGDQRGGGEASKRITLLEAVVGRSLEKGGTDMSEGEECEEYQEPSQTEISSPLATGAGRVREGTGEPQPGWRGSGLLSVLRSSWEGLRGYRRLLKTNSSTMSTNLQVVLQPPQQSSSEAHKPDPLREDLAWEELTNLLLKALDDRCGCGFCGCLGEGGKLSGSCHEEASILCTTTSTTSSTTGELSVDDEHYESDIGDGGISFPQEKNLAYQPQHCYAEAGSIEETSTCQSNNSGRRSRSLRLLRRSRRKRAPAF